MITPDREVGPGDVGPQLSDAPPVARPANDLDRTLVASADLLALQQSAGNAYVAHTLANADTQAPGAIGLRAHRRRGTFEHRMSGAVAQRAPVTTVEGAVTSPSVTIPGGLLARDNDLVARDYPTAAGALKAIAAALDSRAEALDATGAAWLRSVAQLNRAEAARLADSGPLTTDEASYLSGLVFMTESQERQAVDGTLERFIRLFHLAQPSEEDKRRLEQLEDDLAEALHERFSGAEKDELRRLIELDEKVKSWTTKVSKLAGAVDQGCKSLEDLRAAASIAEKAKQLKEFSTDLGEKVDKAKEILEVVNDIATIAGAQGHPDGTAMMKGIEHFAAGIDLIDKTIGRFAEALPLFKDLWDKWYKPMIDACVQGLMKIARLSEIQSRQLAIVTWAAEGAYGGIKRDENGAPVIPPEYIALDVFPGGQPVLSYLYCLRQRRRPPPLPEAVKVFFLDRRDIMNEVAATEDEELTSEWEFLSPSTWSLKGRETNLEPWLAMHWEKVWLMLYGKYGRHVPH